MKKNIKSLISWLYLIYSWIPLIIINVYIILGVREIDSIISNFMPFNIFFSLIENTIFSYVIILTSLILVIIFIVKFKRKLVLSATLLLYTVELVWLFIYVNLYDIPFAIYKDFIIVYIFGLILYIVSIIKWSKYLLIAVTILIILSAVVNFYQKPYCPIESLYDFHLEYGKSSSTINAGTFAIDSDGRWYHLDASGGHRGTPLDTKHYNEDLSEKIIEFFGLKDKIKLD